MNKRKVRRRNDRLNADELVDVPVVLLDTFYEVLKEQPTDSFPQPLREFREHAQNLDLPARREFVRRFIGRLVAALGDVPEESLSPTMRKILEMASDGFDLGLGKFN